MSHRSKTHRRISHKYISRWLRCRGSIRLSSSELYRGPKTTSSPSFSEYDFFLLPWYVNTTVPITHTFGLFLYPFSIFYVNSILIYLSSLLFCFTISTFFYLHTFIHFCLRRQQLISPQIRGWERIYQEIGTILRLSKHRTLSYKQASCRWWDQRDLKLNKCFFEP